MRLRIIIVCLMLFGIFEAFCLLALSSTREQWHWHILHWIWMPLVISGVVGFRIALAKPRSAHAAFAIGSTVAFALGWLLGNLGFAAYLAWKKLVGIEYTGSDWPHVATMALACAGVYIVPCFGAALLAGLAAMQHRKRL